MLRAARRRRPSPPWWAGPVSALAASARRALAWSRGWWAGLGRPARALVAGGLAVVVAGLIALTVLLPSAPAPQARVYLSFTACLLAGERGNADPAAAPAWAGLRDASAATRMQVESLAVPAFATDASPCLASLVVQRCGLVVAAGPGPVAAVDANARRFKTVRFVTVGGQAAAPNVTVVFPAAARSQVAAAAKAALAASGS